MVKPQPEFVRTVFKIYKLCVDPTAAVVALYGSHACMGEWKKEEALMASYNGMNEWQLDTMLPKNSKLVYKLLLLDPRTRHVLQEELFYRHLKTGETPLLVELKFDDSACKTWTVRSKLTGTGTPIASHLPTENASRTTDYPMKDPKEPWRSGASSSYAALKRQEGTALKGSDGIVLRRFGDTSVIPNATSLRRPEGTEYVSTAVNTVASFENSVPKVDEEKKTDVTDNGFTFRQMLPSPYRLAMLGLAVGACIYSKLKT